MDKSKIVLITGGNKGIGLETARQLGKMGYEILLGSRNEKRGLEAVTLSEKEDIKAKTVGLDVTNPTSILSAVEQIEQEYGLYDLDLIGFNNYVKSLGQRLSLLKMKHYHPKKNLYRI
jgi:NAD(P)-dependent dehydrogenase (short-subunit alcohol dehydrogenase family)